MSSTYHVTVELRGGVAAAPVGLRDGLRRVGPDQTPPVNQTSTKTELGRCTEKPTVSYSLQIQ